jgi:hypothetical protein
LAKLDSQAKHRPQTKTAVHCSNRETASPTKSLATAILNNPVPFGALIPSGSIKETIMQTIPANQVATFSNPELGIASTVTTTRRGFAVTLLDTDAEQIVGTYIYPVAMLAQAINKAKQLANV